MVKINRAGKTGGSEVLVSVDVVMLVKVSLVDVVEELVSEEVKLVLLVLLDVVDVDDVDEVVDVVFVSVEVVAVRVVEVEVVVVVLVTSCKSRAESVGLAHTKRNQRKPLSQCQVSPKAILNSDTSPKGSQGPMVDLNPSGK